MSSFNTISQDLIDVWLRSDEVTKPESLYAGIINRLTIKMALSVVTTVADNPYDWRFLRVKDFGFKSHLLNQMKQQFPDAPYVILIEALSTMRLFPPIRVP